MSKHRTFTVGDTVTVPTAKSKSDGTTSIVRVRAEIVSIAKSNGRTCARVIFLAGRRAGLFGYADITECKKPRSGGTRKHYAFGQIVGTL